MGIIGLMAQAQEESTYNESVLVKGSFRPVIEQREKVTFPAVVTDTMTRFEHTFQYSITPRRLNSIYEPARIKAARILGEPATKLYNNYLRLGMGNYWSPLADLYWCSTRDREKTYGVRFNHRSSWGTLPDYGKNHFGLTDVTLFGKYIVADKLQLSTDLNYEHDHNLYYGFTDDKLQTTLGKDRDDISVGDYKAKYNVITWNAGVKNMQLDGYKLGYSANVRVSDLWASWSQNEFNLNFSGDIHYGFKMLRNAKGIAYLHAEWEAYKFSYSPDGTMPLGFNTALYPFTDAPACDGSRNIVKLNPYVDFMYNGLLFHAGLTTGWDGFSDPSKVFFRLFPDVVVSKSLMQEALVVSLGFTGGLDANNWDLIRKINPYVCPGAEQRATHHYDLTGHARWTISKKLEANAEVRYSNLRDDLTFGLDGLYQLDNVYWPIYFDNQRLTAGADIAFVNDEMLTLRFGGHYYYNKTKLAWNKPLYRPDWDLMASADVNYNDKWLFHLEGQLLGKMQGDNNEELPMRYGINAEVEYRHNRALSFFLKMDNLAFQRYYYWSNYPSQRGLFILGLTYTMPHK